MKKLFLLFMTALLVVSPFLFAGNGETEEPVFGMDKFQEKGMPKEAAHWTSEHILEYVAGRDYLQKQIDDKGQQGEEWTQVKYFVYALVQLPLCKRTEFTCTSSANGAIEVEDITPDNLTDCCVGFFRLTNNQATDATVDGQQTLVTPYGTQHTQNLDSVEIPTGTSVVVAIVGRCNATLSLDIFGPLAPQARARVIIKCSADSCDL